MYKLIRHIENIIGGGEGVIGIYGSLSPKSTQSVLHELQCNEDTVLIDVGAGIGRPLFHAIVEYNVKKAIGIEIDEVKTSKALHIKSYLLERNFSQINQVAIYNKDIEKMDGNIVHGGNLLYCCWEGFPEKTKRAIGKLFSQIETMTSVAIIQRHLRKISPCDYMTSLHFENINLVKGPFAVKMLGSNRQLQVYIFSKLK